MAWNLQWACLQVLICDNMALPYKDDCFDAVVSIAVIHHIATTERRVRALRELARVLRVGGRIIISGNTTHFHHNSNVDAYLCCGQSGRWSSDTGGLSRRTC